MSISTSTLIQTNDLAVTYTYIFAARKSVEKDREVMIIEEKSAIRSALNSGQRLLTSDYAWVIRR